MADGKPIIVPIRAGLKGFNKDLSKAETRLGGFGKTAKGILKGVGAGLAGAAAIVGDSVADFAKLDDSVREVGTLLGETTIQQLDTLSDSVRDVAKDFGEAGTEVATAFYDSISSGVADAESVEAFVREAGKFATAGATDIGSGVDLLTSALNAFKLESKDAERVSDVFFSTVKAGKTTVGEIASSFSDIGPAAAVAGVSIEDVSGWLAQLTLSGTPTAKAATQIKGALAELSKGGTKLDKTFKSIVNKSFRDFMDEGGSLEEAFMLIAEEAEQIGQSIFDMAGGVEAAQGILGATENLDNLGEVLDSIGGSAGATQTAFELMEDSTGKKLEKVKASLIDVQYTIGAAFLPVLEQIIPAIEPIAQSIGNLAAELLTALAPALTVIVGELLPPLSELLIALSPLISVLADVLVILAEPLAELAVDLLPLVIIAVETLALAVEALKPILDLLLFVVDLALIPVLVVLEQTLGLVRGVVGLLTGDTELLLQWWDDLADIFGDFGQIAGEVATKVADFATNIASWLWDAFKNHWVLLLGAGGLVYWLFERFDIAEKLLAFGKSVISTVWDSVRDNWVLLLGPGGLVYWLFSRFDIGAKLVEFGKSVISTVWDSVRDNWVLLLGPGGLVYWLFERFDITEKLADFGRHMISWIWDSFKTWARINFITVPTKLWEWIKEGWQTIFQIGKDIGQWVVDGIIELIHSAAGAIASAVGSVVGSAVDSIPIVGDVVSGASSAFGAAKSVVGSVGGFFGFAEGGIVTGPTLGLLGEAGTEAVLPLDQLHNYGVGKGSTVVNVNVYGGLDSAEAIGERVEEALQAWAAHKGDIDIKVA